MSSITKYCLVAGMGIDRYAISSFDSALLNAHVGNYNLVRVSSILPPRCKNREYVDAKRGSVLYMAYATLTTLETEIISSSVAVAVPANEDECGVIMEYSDRNNKEYVIKTVEKLAQEAMVKRNIEVKEILSIGVEALGKNGLCTTTFAGIALF